MRAIFLKRDPSGVAITGCREAEGAVAFKNQHKPKTNIVRYWLLPNSDPKPQCFCQLGVCMFQQKAMLKLPKGHTRSPVPGQFAVSSLGQGKTGNPSLGTNMGRVCLGFPLETPSEVVPSKAECICPYGLINRGLWLHSGKSAPKASQMAMGSSNPPLIP